MKNRIFSMFTRKICLAFVWSSILITFLMFGVNFNTAMPYPILISILLLSMLMGILGYIAYIVKIIYSWTISSNLQNLDRVANAIVLSALSSFSIYVSALMIMSSINYLH